MVIKPEDVKPQTLFTELRPEWMQSDDESELGRREGHARQEGFGGC